MKLFVVSGKKLFSAIGMAALVMAVCIGAKSASVFKVDGREIPIYSVQRNDNKIALTFDCAWNDSDIPSICETLKKHNVRATFFVVGDWAKKYPDSLKMLTQNGHEIGNHSYNHAHYSKLPTDEMISDMDKCDKIIKNITLTDTPLFRAPYGEYNDKVIQACDSSNRTYIQWSVDSIDYASDATRESIIQRCTQKTQSGDIILLHNGTANTAAALDELLTELCKSFTPVTVSELIYKDSYEIDHTGKQKKIEKGVEMVIN